VVAKAMALRLALGVGTGEGCAPLHRRVGQCPLPEFFLIFGLKMVIFELWVVFYVFYTKRESRKGMGCAGLYTT